MNPFLARSGGVGQSGGHPALSKMNKVDFTHTIRWYRRCLVFEACDELLRLMEGGLALTESTSSIALNPYLEGDTQAADGLQEEFLDPLRIARH